MAIESTYYLDGLTLASSTSVFTDENLTICAVDGWYQQDGTVRQMVDCILLDAISCRSCATACGLYIEESLPEGVYSIPIDAGADIGAVIIKFNPNTTPDGIIANFNSVNFNSVSSTNFGYLAAPANLVTYLGVDNAALLAGSPYTLENYNFNGVTFDDKMTTSNVVVTAPQIKTTVTAPGECIMVIPKTVITPSIIDISIINTFASGVFGIDIACPVLLPEFYGSLRASDLYMACESVGSYPYYSASVNGDGTTLGLYDWVFNDTFGQNILSNGYYKSSDIPSPYEWFRVENGTVVEFGMCTSPPTYNLGYQCANNIPNPCDLNIINLTLTAISGVTTIFTSVAPNAGTVSVDGGIYDIALGFTFDALYSPCCEMELVIIYLGIEVATLPIGIPVDGFYYELNTSITVSSVGLLSGVLRCI